LIVNDLKNIKVPKNHNKVFESSIYRKINKIYFTKSCVRVIS